ncbi:cobaltochelatase subunit CobN [Desulfosarcina ovata subsp. sediminis]|uniref:Cobaltochelatase subunit CobN n=1 Tax=Desulfosarcina ovata subsp. sediminis TaxID=885957 RepID=A0A5K7ZQD2_9BACT|nr:cobaltochelatase subunit CobN [Desulfosarcina ovata]BBO82439.1 cobaltochelatase subunit CobN [Desulfosarcina ovata subsp. sediminis]
MNREKCYVELKNQNRKKDSPPLKLVYFSVTSNEIPNLSEATRLFVENVAALEIFARTRTQLDNNPERQAEFVRRALAADAVVVTLMAGSHSCPAWEALTEALSDRRDQKRPLPYLHIQPTGSNPDTMTLVQKHSDGHDDDAWQTLSRYYRYGGVENLGNLLRFLYRRACGGSVAVKAPRQPPYEGLYHPDHGHICDADAYRSALDPAKPTVGIWFYQNFWTSNNKAHIDAMVREVESQGANVICVFHMRFKDTVLGNQGPDYVVEHFFMNDGRPVIDVLVNPVMFSLQTAAPEYKGLLARLNVPVIQAISTGRSIAEWEASDQGLNNVDITISVAQPELDGVIINVPVASKQCVDIDPLTGAAVNKYVAIPERMARMVRLALNWARLRRKPNAEKKVAIVFHHYPPRNDRIGCAAGLDSFASVVDLLGAMKKQGYRVDTDYPDGDALAHHLLAGMTCDRRWLPMDQMATRARASAGPGTYTGWHEKLPQTVREKMTHDWQPIPGDLFVHDGRLFFPGLINGHVFLTIQPPRGYFEQLDKLYHDPHLSPPHHYLAHYRWITETFGADAVIHVGKHGSLEWLPGKAVGLSATCYPDLAIGDLPNIYPYIINDPGEGTQAKRRSYACIIDHLPPPLTNAGLYEDLAEVENLLSEYQAARIQDQGKLDLLAPMIWEAAEKAEITGELNLDKTTALGDVETFLETLHHYLGEIADTAIADGLHILGRAPAGQPLVRNLVQMTRLANGEVPSLRRAVAAALGHDADVLTQHRGRIIDSASGATGAQLLDRTHHLCEILVADLLAGSHDPDVVKTVQQRHLGKAAPDMTDALAFIRNDLLPRVEQTSGEQTACLDALEGRFVPPGPSGAPSRGQAHILPTGRNFYSVDPQKIPTKAAWETGKRLADALIARYREEHDRYPDNVGLILWASPTMRSKGDDVAEILYLLGVRPVWQKGSGNVRGVEIIPAAELGRPRIDVTPRISGIFRDAFPLLVDLIDTAVQMVAALEEKPEDNFIRRHVIRDVADLTANGLDETAAFRQATFRIFGSPPGSYGAGVAQLVESKQWKTTDDLGEMYIRWSSYAYGRDTFGQPAESVFRRTLGRMSVTVKNEDTREKDMLACTDFYNYHGGLVTAVHAVQGRRPLSLAGDSADPDQVVVRTTTEEARHIFRARLLNPKWLEGLKRHGYKGAGDISKAMDIILGWDATADVVDDHMYRRFAEKVPLNPEMAAWMKKVNPHALHNIIDKLLEAASRGMWQADEETLEALQEAFLDAEGEIEEVTDR